MHPPPTQRELVLVAALFITLLFFFSGNRAYTELSNIGLSAVWHDASPPLHSQGIPTLPSLAKISWGSSKVPRTKIITHAPGWTMFDKMYILNGTVYLVSDEPETFPDRKFMTSAGINIENSPKCTAEAKKLFGTSANRIQGVTVRVLANLPIRPPFYDCSVASLFRFLARLLLPRPFIPSSGKTALPPPRRIFFSHLDADHWRSCCMGVPFVFDRVLFADRAAAINGANWLRTQRTASEAFALPGSPNWWSTFRNNVIDTGAGTRGRPVITYISRQEWGRRMLIQQDHDKLVEELYKLRDQYGYEVNVVSMDKLSRVEQLRLAGRTTIMMGVHGNGLTALLWMKPTPRSTVMEFFFPGGFAHDYEYTTRALGMVHYGFWGNSYFSGADVPPVAYPEGFQGNEIPIDGAVVARLVHERLSLAEEADD
ncbi:hypothetical protein EI94DRAFT_1715877 [Lactarius quietus]|nr:hypothetical protein EI94DRAFT_1715877 [Lactarius quietus]